jgi:kynureninase
MFELGEDFAKKLDMVDPLKDFKKRFFLKKNEIYMCDFAN